MKNILGFKISGREIITPSKNFLYILPKLWTSVHSGFAAHKIEGGKGKALCRIGNRVLVIFWDDCLFWAGKPMRFWRGLFIGLGQEGLSFHQPQTKGVFIPFWIK